MINTCSSEVAYVFERPQPRLPPLCSPLRVERPLFGRRQTRGVVVLFELAAVGLAHPLPHPPLGFGRVDWLLMRRLCCPRELELV